ncbi:MAG: exodeoxyribonuclease VII large subunit [Acholeplasmataceae bacterium]
MEYLTVSALTKYIKTKLETDKHLVSIWLKGEISNFKRHSRGHLYFTLKDDQAQISAIMFASTTQGLSFSPKEGDHVLVEGKISLYEPSGSYSIQVFKMTLDGVGELYLKYEQLKKDLEAKGYFNQEHKKAIPMFPSKIGVITSPTGAVIQDIKNTVSRRYKLTEIHLYPALVQGAGAKESIVGQIELANQKNDVDVLIVGRGGGSIEDLWGFNELDVVMAIFHSKIPIITAIGHETDYTLSDFVSDLRAPTPSAAAELATPSTADLIEQIGDHVTQLKYRMDIIIRQLETHLLYLDKRLEGFSPTHQLKTLEKTYDDLKQLLNRNYHIYLDNKKRDVTSLKQGLISPQDKIDHYKERYTYLNGRLKKEVETLYLSKHHQFQLLKSVMMSLNPLSVMDKGFALIKKEDDIITSINQVKLNETLTLYLKDGQLQTKVVDKKGNDHGKKII